MITKLSRKPAPVLQFGTFDIMAFCLLVIVLVCFFVWLIRQRKFLAGHGKNLFLQAFGYWRALKWSKRAALLMLLLLAWFRGGIYIYRGIPRDENDVYGYHDERKLISYAMSYPVSIMTYNDFGYPTGYHTLLGISSLPLRLPSIVAFGLGGSQYSTGTVRSQFIRYFLLVLGRHMSVFLSAVSVALVFWIGILLFRKFFWAFALAFAYCIDPCNVFSSYIFKPDVAIGTFAICCYGCVLSGWISDEPKQARVWFGLTVVFGVLCACFKYSAICVYPIFLLVVFSRHRREVLSVRFFIRIGITSLAIVLFLCPGLVLRPQYVWCEIGFELLRTKAMHDPLPIVFVRNYGAIRSTLIVVAIIVSALLALVRRQWDILVLFCTLIPTIILFRRFSYIHYLSPVSVTIPMSIIFLFREGTKGISFVSVKKRCAIGAVCAILFSLGLFGPLDFRHGRWLLHNKTMAQSASDFAIAHMSKTATYDFSRFLWEPRGKLRIVPNQTIAHDGVAFFRSSAPEYLFIEFSSDVQMALDDVYATIRSFDSNGRLADYYYQYKLDDVFKLWKEAIESDFSPYTLMAQESPRGRRYREFGPGYYHYHFLLYKRNREVDSTQVLGSFPIASCCRIELSAHGDEH